MMKRESCAHDDLCYGRLRPDCPAISLADAFAVTLAEREQGILVTSDHHEFDPLLASGSLPICVRFIR
jgi:hypothetical protein